MTDHIDYAAAYLADKFEDDSDDPIDWTQTVTDLFDDLAARGFSITRIPHREVVGAQAEAILQWQRDHPEATMDELMAEYDRRGWLREGFWTLWEKDENQEEWSAKAAKLGWGQSWQGET